MSSGDRNTDGTESVNELSAVSSANQPSSNETSAPERPDELSASNGAAAAAAESYQQFWGHTCANRAGSEHPVSRVMSAANSIPANANLASGVDGNPGNMGLSGEDYVGASLMSENDNYFGGPSQEIENGYPLVADLQQLRLRNQIRLSVDDVIEQEVFRPESMEEAEEIQRRLMDEANITGHDFIARIDETIGIVTEDGEIIRPPLRFCDPPVFIGGRRRPRTSIQDGVEEPGMIELVPESGVIEVEPGSGVIELTAGSGFRIGGRVYNGDSGSQPYPLHNAAAVGRTVNDALKNGNTSAGNPNERNEMPGMSYMGWQASKSTVKERFAYLYCNEVLADVWFVVGRGDQMKRIPAHKFILITGSAVFDAMFNGALAENTTAAEGNNKQSSKDIELPDVEPAAFLALLKFLYTDDVSIGPEIVMTTLYTAKKYAVPAMEHACVDFLKRNLGADNAFMLLTQARLFDEPQLANLCLDIIDKNTIEALNAEGFTEIDFDTLCIVLKRNTLRIREAPLFLAVLRWTVEECRRRSLAVTAENQRKVLGKALHMIRFPLMTIDEFAQHAAQTGILTDRELVNMFLHFTVNPKPETGFLEEPRCCVFGKEVVVSRFQRVEGRWGYSGTPDRIKQVYSLKPSMSTEHVGSFR